MLQRFLEVAPGELADLVEVAPERVRELPDLNADDLCRILEALDPGRLREVFLELSPEVQRDVIAVASVRLSLLILRSLEPEQQRALLDSLQEGPREEISQVLEFSEHTAGFYMERPSAQYRIDQSVSSALARLRRSGQVRARSLYVVDDNNVLVGRVDLQDMAMAEPGARLGDLINPVEGVVLLTAPRDELVRIFDLTRVDSVPIVTPAGELLGIVRYTSLFQAAEDLASVDIQTMVGASADERALSTAWFAVRKRLPWLHINLLTAFLAAAVVALFEDTIAQFTALAILLPVVAGQSGNAGSQALAVTMRGLALKEINLNHWRPVMMKEIQAGIINGIALAVTCGLGVFLWSGSTGLALIIAVAMVVSLAVACVSGALVPILLTRARQDPATASSIVLTTITDVAGFLTFLGTASSLSFLL